MLEKVCFTTLASCFTTLSEIFATLTSFFTTLGINFTSLRFPLIATNEKSLYSHWNKDSVHLFILFTLLSFTPH